MNSQTEYLISVVVPCYNCQETLKTTMDSLLGQGRADDGQWNYQIVLVDDGSTDSTGDLCDEYAVHNSNVKVLHKPNGGLVDAWKTGVMNASSSYIAFCDADDFLDEGFISRIVDVIGTYSPDLIVFGIKTHFDNGDEENNDILLPEGFYDRKAIEKEVFPKYFSDGSMQSELMFSGRWNKVYKISLLKKIINDVPNAISFGEDDVTSFLTILNADSIYSIAAFYPYHYVRSDTSMIGKYDESVFDKINYLYGVLKEIAVKYGYPYDEQLHREYLSIFYLYAKKEICKNPSGYKEVKKNLIKAKQSDYYIESYAPELIGSYQLPNRFFVRMIAGGMYWPSYVIARLFEKIRGRNV